ncbi:MAG: hypothetical protein K2X91_04085 [Thermoleophilia bacterium]|nr:hypothetical protein [Thermoleophilia bacterium]
MTITTLMAETTATVRRPFLQRISHHLTGRPASPCITLPLIAEVLLELEAYGAAPTIRIVILEGRPAILLEATATGFSRAKVIEVRRATIREKGAAGRIFPVLWADPEEVAAMEAAAAVISETMAELPITLLEPEPVHIGMDLSSSPDLVSHVDLGQTFTREEEEAAATWAHPAGPAAAAFMMGGSGDLFPEGEPEAGPAVHAVAESIRAGLARAEYRRTLITMAQHHEAEAERFRGMRESTTVAKRRADYAMRERTHAENAAALRRASARIVPPDRVEPAPTPEA